MSHKSPKEDYHIVFTIEIFEYLVFCQIYDLSIYLSKSFSPNTREMITVLFVLDLVRDNCCGVHRTNVKLPTSQVPLADLQCMRDEDTSTALIIDSSSVRGGIRGLKMVFPPLLEPESKIHVRTISSCTAPLQPRGIPLAFSKNQKSQCSRQN